MANKQKYLGAMDAVQHLKRNGCRVEMDGRYIKVIGSPGLHLLGAIDFMRQTFYVKLSETE